MLIIRETFQIHPEKMKVAKQSVKGMIAIAKNLENSLTMRAMFDVVADFYTLVFETEVESMHQFETEYASTMTMPEWQEWYSTFRPCIASGKREVFMLID